MQTYWYISDAKLEVLKQSMPRTWTQDLIIKLKFKAPWLEVEVGHRDLKTSVTNSQLIEKALLKSDNIPFFTDLSEGEVPNFVRFKAQGARAVVEDGYWIASYKGASALLLAGSAKHAIGASATPTGHISPSIDPFGAANSMSSAGVPKTISENLSYVWQEVFRIGGGAKDASIPTVEGIALFAGRFPTARRQVRRAGLPSLTHLVLASPIFVRQVTDANAA